MLKDTMVFLQCDNGSKVVRVACPKCGRISFQILKVPYAGTMIVEFEDEVKCPVCGTTYQLCSTRQSETWNATLQKHGANINAYNSAIKDTYARKLAAEQRKKNTPLSEWTDLFQMTILNRGKTYARRGTVRNLVRTDISYTATVEGTHNYQVKIGIEKGGISSLNCTCPYAAKGEMCKHMAAVLYVAVDGIQETATANTISPPPVSKPESNHDIQKLASILQYSANTEPRSTPVQLSADKNTRPAEHSYDQVTEESEANPTDIALERKVNRWKKELLDTGKRNKMINYRETSRTTLKILEPGLEELFNKLAISEKELSFQKPINKDSDFRTYAFLSLLETLSYNLPVHVGDIKAVGTIVEREKTLKNLRAKTKLAREEQGTNILYLSFGFILWRENDRPSSTWMKAPLLMMPVSLEMKSLNAPYTISRYEDDIEVNPTLDYLLNAEYGIDLPAFELKDKKSITTYLDMIEEIIDRRGWKLIREVSLGLLSFQKINMYHDLNNDHNQQLIVKHPVLRAMSGDYSAVKGIPEELQGMNFDSINPKNCYQVVNADSSQQDAIMLSKSGVSFVMQGPPGTGKSQTITNIIAEALADGKKVLFVSEKAAALQVVLKRLTEVGLSDFCLSLHDYKANKKVIIDNIGANLELTAPRISRADIGRLTELLHSRAYLNVYAEELHKSIAPLECSIYTAYGRITQLSDATVVECNIIDPMAITKDTFTEMLYNVEMFERALHAMGTPLHENPWYMTTATSSGQAFKLQLSKDTKNLPEELPKIEQQICELNTSFNLEIPDTWSGIQHGIHSVNEILSLPLFPYAWASNETITSLITRANGEHQRTQKYIEDTKTFTAQYSAKAQIGKQHTDHLLRCQNLLHTDWTQDVWQLDVSDIRSRYQNNYGDAKKSVRSVIQSAAEGSKCALATLQDILGLYDIANKLLRINRPDSISNIRFVADLASMLSDAPYMESTWFDPRKNAEIVPLIDEACQHSESIQERTAKLLEHWEDDVLALDADSMLARFKTEHTGLFHKFKATYKEDIKTLKVLAKQVGVQISEEDAVKLLNAVKDLNDEKEWFLKNKESLTAVFNRKFRGVETDWSKLRYGVRAALDIANMFPYANIPADVITAIQEAIDSTQKSAQLRQVNAELTREKIETLISELADLSYIDFVDEDLPLSGSYLPKLEEAIASCHEQEEYLNTISACRVSGKEELTYSDIVNMLDLVAEIYTEQRWFKNNHASLADMFGNQYTGADTDWDTIASKMDIGQSSYMRELTESFNATVPELEEMFDSRYVGTETKWLCVAQELSQIKECLESIDDQSPITDKFISLVCNSAETREAVEQRKRSQYAAA